MTTQSSVSHPIIFRPQLTAGADYARNRIHVNLGLLTQNLYSRRDQHLPILDRNLQPHGTTDSICDDILNLASFLREDGVNDFLKAERCDQADADAQRAAASPTATSPAANAAGSAPAQPLNDPAADTPSADAPDSVTDLRAIIEEEVVAMFSSFLATAELLAVCIEAYYRIKADEEAGEMHQTWAETMSAVSCEISEADLAYNGYGTVEALKVASALLEQLSSAARYSPTQSPHDDLFGGDTL